MRHHSAIFWQCLQMFWREVPPGLQNEMYYSFSGQFNLTTREPSAILRVLFIYNSQRRCLSNTITLIAPWNIFCSLIRPNPGSRNNLLDISWAEGTITPSVEGESRERFRCKWDAFLFPQKYGYSDLVRITLLTISYMSNINSIEQFLAMNGWDIFPVEKWSVCRSVKILKKTTNQCNDTY